MSKESRFIRVNCTIHKNDFGDHDNAVADELCKRIEAICKEDEFACLQPMVEG